MNSQADTEQLYQRFPLFQRIIHFVVMVGFLGLSVTGLSLAFSAYSLPRACMWLMGGQENAAFLHRFFALITFVPVLIHALWFLYYKYVLKKDFFNPQSVIFQGYDLKHLGQNFLYFFGKRDRPPLFYRFNYLQKLFYWAVFLGMFAMAATGLLHMYPEFFARFLPGYAFNIAQTIHFWEAILAIVVKVLFHAMMEHLRPSIFPMDKSIFTGMTPVSVLKREHPNEWKAI